jgi:branched-chain amino acid transport system ATP-binding protein
MSRQPRFDPAASPTAVDVPTLSVESLDVYRGEAHVLHGASFTVPPQQVTALLGRNGAGKTSTLMAIMSLLEKTGDIRLEGQDITSDATHVVAMRGIGYVPEDREVFSRLTVEENLRLAERPDTPRDRIDYVAELFPDLVNRAKQMAGTLSGGQQQMLSLGRVLLNPAKLLLIDEPSKGLAPIVVDQITDALREVAKTTTVLLVEQNLEMALALAHEAVVLDHGSVVFIGPMSQLLEDETLAHRYLGVGVDAEHGVG